MVAQVIGVGAVQDVIEAFFGGDALQGFVERSLAVEAAIDWIGTVVRLAEFVGDDDPMLHAPALGQFHRELKVAALEAARTGGDGEGVRAQRLGGNVGDEGAVDAARVGDEHPAQGADARLEALVLGFEFRVHNRLIILARKPAPKPLSMFTTETPDAQLFSMPRRAARPPNAAP